MCQRRGTEHKRGEFVIPHVKIFFPDPNTNSRPFPGLCVILKYQIPTVSSIRDLVPVEDFIHLNSLLAIDFFKHKFIVFENQLHDELKTVKFYMQSPSCSI